MRYVIVTWATGEVWAGDVAAYAALALPVVEGTRVRFGTRLDVIRARAGRRAA